MIDTRGRGEKSAVPLTGAEPPDAVTVGDEGFGGGLRVAVVAASHGAPRD